jgi:hypothetical protein
MPSIKPPPAYPDPSRVVEEGFGEVKQEYFKGPLKINWRYSYEVT